MCLVIIFQILMIECNNPVYKASYTAILSTKTAIQFTPPPSQNNVGCKKAKMLFKSPTVSGHQQCSYGGGTRP